jgi:hypothetical protein
MGIRDTLKKREEQREAAQNGGPSDLPEGVKRYVGMGSYGEVNKDGRTFVLLADPDNWYFYFVHEDKTFDGKKSVHAFESIRAYIHRKKPTQICNRSLDQERTNVFHAKRALNVRCTP